MAFVHRAWFIYVLHGYRRRRLKIIDENLPFAKSMTLYFLLSERAPQYFVKVI